jgi:multicomponent Na+:H+ antiporter subunit B
MRKVLAVLLLAIVGYYMIDSFLKIPFGENRNTVGDYYLNTTVKETGSVNTVTSIVVNYRGFDTLGEVTVLFLATTGLAAILFENKKRKRRLQHASLIVRVGAHLIYPLIILLGAYVFIHGHLTPGGGFQGGAIIATGVLLMFMSYRSFEVSHKLLVYFESIAGIAFVTIGLSGLIWGTSFLENILPLGIPNSLFSAGVIPIIYIAVGVKVGAELTGLLDNLLKTIK